MQQPPSSHTPDTDQPTSAATRNTMRRELAKMRHSLLRSNSGAASKQPASSETEPTDDLGFSTEGSEIVLTDPSNAGGIVPIALPQEASDRIQLAIDRFGTSVSDLHAALEWRLSQPIHDNVVTGRRRSSSRGAFGLDAGTVAATAAAAAAGRTVIGVTSTIPGEGKTTVALNLAFALARNTCQSVCLIDLSLGSNDLCRRLGLVNQSEGVVPVLEGRQTTIRTLLLGAASTADGTPFLMPAGGAPESSARAARSPAVAEILAAARQMFDIVIVDMPSISSGDARPVAMHLDGTILVVRAGATPRAAVRAGAERLGREKMIGVVLNRTRSSVPAWVSRVFPIMAPPSGVNLSAMMTAGR